MQKTERIRENLARLYKEQNADKRYKFEGTFVRFGHSKRDPEIKTAVLENVYLIKEDGSKEFVTDHAWIKVGKKFKNFVKRIKNRYDLELKTGNKIHFQAFIDQYYKEGKERFFKDYRFSSLRHIELPEEPKWREEAKRLLLEQLEKEKAANEDSSEKGAENE